MNTLTQIREKLNEVDTALLRLLRLRCTLSQEVHKVKKEAMLPIYDPHRENEVLEELILLNKDLNKDILSPLSEKDIREVWTCIFTISKGIQQENEENNLPSPSSL